MRPQKIAIIVVAGVAGSFLLAGVVVLSLNFLMNSDSARMLEMQMPPEQKIANNELAKHRGNSVLPEEFTLSAPYTRGNLTIFLIHGPDAVKDAKILTLRDALELDVATVHETGAGQLLIDNRSDQPLLIQAGDIVKGGTQDRTLPYDMLISGNSAQTPISALCVEQGRSFPRGDEVSTSFATATQRLPGRKLRLAAMRKSQIDVWNHVQALQANLANNAGGSVEAPLSRTSLQLSLEHHRVQDAVQDYLVTLDPAVNGKKDVIGYVVAINGTIQSADIYASADLFQRTWPKLLRASAVAALAEKQPGHFNAPNADAVKQFLANTGGEAFLINSGNAGHVIRQESAGQVYMDVCDWSKQNAVLHRAILAK